MRGGNDEIWTGTPRPEGDWMPSGAICAHRDKAGRLLGVSRQRQRVRTALATVGKAGRYRVVRIGKGNRWLLKVKT